MGKKDFFAGVLTGALVAAVAGTGGTLGYFYGFLSSGNALSAPDKIEKIRCLEELIDEEYYGDIQKEDLAEGMYAGLVSGLGDPYSRYYTAREYEEENSSAEGSYTGIGILMQKDPEGVLVMECYKGGPGEQAGLLAGDVISAIDDTDLADMELEQVAELVKKSSADSLSLTVRREGAEELMTIEVPVRNVELPSVYSEMLNERTGYIQITEFKGVTVHQYQDAFQELSEQGMEKLVVDLRNNPGGLLDSVCGVLEEILPEGLIVYTEDKNGEREEYYSEGEHPLEMPLAVLVNGNSASASEIFAGAVQDYGIGKIVGTVTYGKGIVQGISRLSDGSAVKLTISQYFTPKGNSIHQTGIIPDVEAEPDPQFTDPGSISREEDLQLKEALKTLGEAL